MWLMIVMVVGLVGIPMMFGPMQMGLYSALPAALYGGAPVKVSGNLEYANGTPVVGAEIRIFATDELIEEFMITDENGYFESIWYYESGQIITVEYNGIRIYPRMVPTAAPAPFAFIEYDVQDLEGPYWLGIYIVDEG